MLHSGGGQEGESTGEQGVVGVQEGGEEKGRRREFLKGVKQGKEEKILLCNNVRHFITFTFISTCENTKRVKDLPPSETQG